MWSEDSFLGKKALTSPKLQCCMSKNSWPNICSKLLYKWVKTTCTDITLETLTLILCLILKLEDSIDTDFDYKYGSGSEFLKNTIWIRISIRIQNQILKDFKICRKQPYGTIPYMSPEVFYESFIFGNNLPEKLEKKSHVRDHCSRIFCERSTKIYFIVFSIRFQLSFCLLRYMCLILFSKLTYEFHKPICHLHDFSKIWVHQIRGFSSFP